ncbi:hypothetical protein K3495_g16595, partial [Podosphaera aphanis]
SKTKENLLLKSETISEDSSVPNSLNNPKKLETTEAGIGDETQIIEKKLDDAVPVSNVDLNSQENLLKNYDINSMEIDTIVNRDLIQNSVKEIVPKLQPQIGSSRYSLRSRKRVGSKEDEERQAKRIRAMLSLLVENIDYNAEDEGQEFALSAMKNPIIYGKDSRKAIFQRLYAIFCRVPDSQDDYAMPAKLIQGIPIPRTYKEAMRSQHSKEWEQAVKLEIDQLILNGTWEEFVLPQGANLVSTKWVFTI